MGGLAKSSEMFIILLRVYSEIKVRKRISMDQYAHVLFKERFMYAPTYVRACMCGYIHAQRPKKGAT